MITQEQILNKLIDVQMELALNWANMSRSLKCCSMDSIGSTANGLSIQDISIQDSYLFKL